jgi:hypothetical protein
MSFLKSGLFVLSALTLTLAAHADSFTTGSYESGNSTSASMNFTYNGNAMSGAGGNLAGSTGVVNGVATSFPEVFCVDLNDEISLNTTYAATYTRTGVVNGSTVNNAGAIAWLIDNLSSSATTTAQNEGLQAAIWETEYGSAFVLASNTSSSILSAYNADLTALGSKTAAVNSVVWMSPTNSNGSYAQGQVAVDPLSPVPEPGTLTLLGTGALGLAGIVRRKAKSVMAA